MPEPARPAPGGGDVNAGLPEGVLARVRDLRTHFHTEEGVVRAVDGASFEVRQGQTLCLVGESGCGKSITARSITQVVGAPGRIVGGEILFRSGEGTVDLARLDPRGRRIRAIRGREIGMVFQEPMSALSPVHTIGDQIGEAIVQHARVGRAEARELTAAALARVGIPRARTRLGAYPFELSGGMRQRACIAMALACRPRLLIADEPTTALDVTTQAGILDLVRELQAELGMAVLFITHDLGVVAEIADTVAVMYLGLVVESGPVEAIFRAPRHPYTRALLRSVPRLGARRRGRLASIRGIVPHPANRPRGCPYHTRCEVAVPGRCGVEVPPVTRTGEGAEVRCVRHAEPAPPAPAGAAAPMPAAAAAAEHPIVLDVRALKMHFPIRAGLLRRAAGRVRAVDGVSFALARGETLGLVGESGCGKTTTGRCLVRLVEPTEGSIVFRPEAGREVDVTSLDRAGLKAYRRAVRMVLQDPQSSLNPRLSVLDIVGEPLKAHAIARGRELEDRVAGLLRRVGLRPEYLRRYPHAFSGGERQRIGIARALATGPSVVVCDEAVSALDVSVQAQILNLLKDLQDELGLTYLFVAHDLSVVEYACDRVAVMYVGRLVEVAATEALYARPLHPYTEALLSAVPRPDPGRAGAGRIRLEGEVADPARPPAGCHFHPRCRYADALCAEAAPPLRELVPGRLVACHHAERLALAGVADA